MDRRTVLAGMGGAAAAALLAGCQSNNKASSGGSSVKLTTVKYQTGLGVFAQEAPFYYGSQLGLFQKEGIDLQIVPGPSGTKNLDTLRAGKVDITSLDSEAYMYGVGTGHYSWSDPKDGIKIVAAVHQSTLGCISALQNPVKGHGKIGIPADLKGKTIGGIVPYGAVYQLFPSFAKLTGFDPSTIHWVPAQAQDFGSLLASGKLDAVTNFVTTEDSTAAAAHGPLISFKYSDHLPELYGNVLLVTNTMLSQKKGLVEAFVRATRASLKATIANPDQAAEAFIKIDPKYFGGLTSAKTEIGVLIEHLGEPAVAGTMDQTRVAQMIASLAQRGLINTGEPHAQPGDLVDFGIAAAS